MSLIDLPPEILALVLDFLPPRDLLTLPQVNRTLQLQLEGQARNRPELHHLRGSAFTWSVRLDYNLLHPIDLTPIEHSPYGIIGFSVEGLRIYQSHLEFALQNHEDELLDFLLNEMWKECPLMVGQLLSQANRVDLIRKLLKSLGSDSSNQFIRRALLTGRVFGHVLREDLASLQSLLQWIPKSERKEYYHEALHFSIKRNWTWLIRDEEPLNFLLRNQEFFFLRGQELITLSLLRVAARDETLPIFLRLLKIYQSRDEVPHLIYWDVAQSSQLGVLGTLLNLYPELRVEDFGPLDQLPGPVLRFLFLEQRCFDPNPSQLFEAAVHQGELDLLREAYQTLKKNQKPIPLGIFTATSRGHREVVEFLLELKQEGVKFDHDFESTLPLAINEAIIQDHLGILKLLLPYLKNPIWLRDPVEFLGCYRQHSGRSMNSSHKHSGRSMTPSRELERFRGTIQQALDRFFDHSVGYFELPPPSTHESETLKYLLDYRGGSPLLLKILFSAALLSGNQWLLREVITRGYVPGISQVLEGLSQWRHHYLPLLLQVLPDSDFISRLLEVIIQGKLVNFFPWLPELEVTSELIETVMNHLLNSQSNEVDSLFVGFSKSGSQLLRPLVDLILGHHRTWFKRHLNTSHFDWMKVEDPELQRLRESVSSSLD